jgi:hypothetical protein
MCLLSQSCKRPHRECDIPVHCLPNSLTETRKDVIDACSLYELCFRRYVRAAALDKLRRLADAQQDSYSWQDAFVRLAALLYHRPFLLNINEAKDQEGAWISVFEW